MKILQESNGATQQDVNNIEVNGSKNVINVGSDHRKREGIKQLLDYVQHEAIHDSNERGDFGCHPGTREEYIRQITSWGKGEWESEKRAFLMTGPAGAGKSAIARDCAYKLEELGHLGASFFFYRPNSWNDPKKFIPTIVHQLTARYSTYRDCIDEIILRNPLVLKKEMKTQFLELLVKPLRQQSVNGDNVGTGLVVVIDGLDECADVDAQVQVINLVATSIRERTTPFSWAFFSRPEPLITSAFSREISTDVSWKLPLTLSGNADSDIEAYLRASFNMIRAKHSIPDELTWPKEAVIHALVSKSAGLFAYAATAIRYVAGLGNGRGGIEERLRTVLQVDAPSAENPFSALDQLYTLLMARIPEGVLSTTLSLLFLDMTHAYHLYMNRPDNKVSRIDCYCLALDLSLIAFHAAISNLYSVLQVASSEFEERNAFLFYHRSFLDFLTDSSRSKLYYIFSPAVIHQCLEKVVYALIRASGPNAISPSSSSSFPLQAFFVLGQRHGTKLEESHLRQVSQVVWKNLQGTVHFVHFPTFIKKIPVDWRTKIIHPSSLRKAVSKAFDGKPFFYTCKKGSQFILRQLRAILIPQRYLAPSYSLGNGDNRAFLTSIDSFTWILQ